jgi:gliding motility-associated protein GldM
MASGKLSPRQKMINMMYLVLTALLALNISKEVLNAFVTVNTSLVNSKYNLAGKNEETYQDFRSAMILNPVKTKPFYDKAMKVKAMSDSMISYLENTKDMLIRKVEKLDPNEKTPELIDVGAKDNYDVPTHIMCGDENDGKGHEASTLKEKLKKFKDDLLSLLDDKTDKDKPAIKKSLEVSLSTEDPDPKDPKNKDAIGEGKRTWEMFNFYHNPLAATVVMLSKFQNDIKNAEAAIINHLKNAIDKTDFKFNTVSAKVIANSNYVMEGEEYSADIFVAASDSTQKPEIWLGQYDTIPPAHFIGTPDTTSVKTVAGVGVYKTHPGGEGPQKWGGVIRVKNPATNEVKEYPFHAEYIAAKSALVVSPDKMNVFYIGVENPVSISVPGIPAENVTASITNGTITGSRGHYIVTVSTPGTANISVSYKTGTGAGTTKSMGPKEFRVMRIPPPHAEVGGKTGGNVTKDFIAIQYGIIPKLDDFVFDAHYTMVSYKFEYVKNGDRFTIDAEGGTFTQKIKDVIKSLPSKSAVDFSFLKVRGPDGVLREINGVHFVIL